MKLCLGLDASKLRCGWALVDAATGTPVDCSTILYPNTDEAIDTGMAWLHWRTLSRGSQIIVVYVEAPHIGPSRRGSIEHAMAVGRVLQAAWHRWPEAAIQLIQPTEWRHVVGLAGNSKKPAVKLWARDFGFDPPDQDAADAAAIAVAGYLLNTQITNIWEAKSADAP